MDRRLRRRWHLHRFLSARAGHAAPSSSTRRRRRPTIRRARSSTGCCATCAATRMSTRRRSTRLAHGTTVATNCADPAQGRQGRADHHRAAFATCSRSAARPGRISIRFQLDHPEPLVPRELPLRGRRADHRRRASVIAPLDEARLAQAVARGARVPASMPARCACCSPSSIPSTSAGSARRCAAAAPDLHRLAVVARCSRNSASTSASRPPCSMPICSR